MNPRLAAIALVALVALAGFGLWCASAQPPAACSGPPEPVTVGKMPIAAHALLYIADDRGFFAENGLAVTVRDFETGPAAMDALLAGAVDLAASGEFVVVESALEGEAVGVLACVDRYEFFSLAARRDRGIANASDLAGKTIGVGRRSNGDFFLGRFLELNGIALSDVRLADVPPSQWVEAVANGSLDAVVYNQQHHDALAARLGENGVVFPVQSDQPLYSLLVARDEWTAGHPETARRFLAALDQADRYAADHPAEARRIVRVALNVTPAETETIWQQNRYALSLDQSLVAAMEDQARWMIANNLTDATAVPDFGEYVDPAPLEQVRPDAVRLIGRGGGAA